MRDERGFALIAALWLVVAISTVGLQLGLAAQQRRLATANAVETVRAQAAADAGVLCPPCHDDATCQVTGGGAACVCNPGFEGDGLTCAPDGTGACVLTTGELVTSLCSRYSSAWAAAAAGVSYVVAAPVVVS